MSSPTGLKLVVDVVLKATYFKFVASFFINLRFRPAERHSRIPMLYIFWYGLYFNCSLIRKSLHLDPFANHMLKRKSYLSTWAYYYPEYFFDVCDTLFWRPSFSLRFIQDVLSGTSVKVDLDRYYKDNCMDSDYPDQVESVKSTRNYSKEQGPLITALSYTRKCAHFCVHDLEETQMERFIELMPSITLNEFSKTCKKVYYTCLNLRGIEMSYFNNTDQVAVHLDGEVPQPASCVSKNGRLMSSRECFRQNPQLEQFIVCRDTLRSPHIGWTVPNQTYRQLILTFEEGNFMSEYKNQLQLLLHDGVRSVKLFIHANENETDDLTLESLMDFLNSCQKVTKIGVSFHEICCQYLRLFLGNPVMLTDTHNVLHIKEALEGWFQSRPDLEFFKLIYDFNGYMLHDGKFKLLEKFSTRKWYLTRNFWNIHARKIENCQFHFLGELECPFYFEPHCFDQYII